MKNILYFLSFLLLFQVLPAQGQTDSITVLDEVRLSDVQLSRNSRGQTVSVLQDSTITENDPFLTNLLKFNTPVFFRENGYGMVSSASFRGTTASQTAVVWNGININSQFNGQTDFNTINTTHYEEIAVRAGGGSVLYGSGAIGGSIHLNNRFRFEKRFQNNIRIDYGSFNTRIGRYSTEISSENSSGYINLSGTASDNDYQYAGTELYNRNGDFENYSFSGGFARWMDKKNLLKFYTEQYVGERGFSGTLTAPSRSKYENVNSRNLVEWKGLFNAFTSTLKIAYLDEQYKYFENRNREDYSFGHARIFNPRYDLNYRITSSIMVNGTVDHRTTRGEGSDIGENVQDITAVAFLFTHNIGRWFYEISTRKEFTNTYQSPLLFSFSTGYEVASNYEVTFNASRNFRIPTFNDLFWRAGGNSDLKPESSYQAELGHNLQGKNFQLGMAAYYIEIQDLLRWIPADSGLWRPVNTQKVRNYGVELRGELQEDFNNHKVRINGTYAYTKTRDLDLGKELVYVPVHKATGNVGYSFGNFSMFYQTLYNGSIFTSSDNEYSLEAYTISNIGIAYRVGQKDFLKLGLEVRNIFGENYQSLPSRPMPGRSYNSSITIKI